MTPTPYRLLCLKLLRVLETCPPTSDSDWVANRMRVIYEVREQLKQVMTPVRLIVALAATETGGQDLLYAVCDDGSVWGIGPWRDETWQRLPDIPMEEEP